MRLDATPSQALAVLRAISTGLSTPRHPQIQLGSKWPNSAASPLARPLQLASGMPNQSKENAYDPCRASRGIRSPPKGAVPLV